MRWFAQAYKSCNNPGEDNAVYVPPINKPVLEMNLRLERVCSFTFQLHKVYYCKKPGKLNIPTSFVIKIFAFHLNNNSVWLNRLCLNQKINRTQMTQIGQIYPDCLTLYRTFNLYFPRLELFENIR